MSETKVKDSQANEKDPELFDVYELGYHLLPDIPEDKVPEEVNKIKKLLESFDAEFISEGEPEFMDLAYTIYVPRGGHNDKYNQAYFGWIKFRAPKANLPELQKELKLNQSILRFILFKTVEEDTRANIKIEDENKKESNDESANDEAGSESSQEQSAETEDANSKMADNSTDEIDDEIDKALEDIKDVE